MHSSLPRLPWKFEKKAPTNLKSKAPKESQASKDEFESTIHVGKYTSPMDPMG